MAAAAADDNNADNDDPLITLEDPKTGEDPKTDNNQNVSYIYL